MSPNQRREVDDARIHRAVLWYPVKHLVDPDGNNGAGFLPPYGPTSCDGYQYQQRDQTDTSLELRLTSAGDQSPRWVAGVYAAAIERRVVVSQGSDSVVA